MTSRRSFLAGILSAAIAPAYVGSSVLMPVRKIITAETELARLIRETRERTMTQAEQAWRRADADLKKYLDDFDSDDLNVMPRFYMHASRGPAEPAIILDYPAYVRFT